MLKLANKVTSGINRTVKATSKFAGGSAKNVHKVASTITPAFPTAGVSLVGAAAMTTASMLKGGLSEIESYSAQTHIRNMRHSSKLAGNIRNGRASARSTISVGNHTGLSLSLHKSRHG